MRSQKRALLAYAGALIPVCLTLYAYRELPGRPFAADDFQWLLKVRGLAPGELLWLAFDPLAQRHFYRPLVWLLLWLQEGLFGLDPRGFHAVSIALHLMVALLAGLLAAGGRWLVDGGWWAVDDRRQATSHKPQATSHKPPSFLIVATIVLLHPAPFEAIVWISAQSELLGTLLLLLALLLWLRGIDQPAALRWPLLATLTLGLAMLAKESAVLGLPLMVALGWRRGIPARRYLLPSALSLAFLSLQIVVGRENTVLRAGLYGFGPQLVTNPLRSLALLVAPMPSTEHADADWLAPLGALIAAGLLLLAVVSLVRRGPWVIVLRMITALFLTLAPTAPFLSPPDSRYLYLPVVFAAITIGVAADAAGQVLAGKRVVGRLFAAGVLAALLLSGWMTGELAAREARFAAASGPGGSLWQLATKICVDVRPPRMVLVDSPILPEHAEAIVRLACGETRAVIVSRDGLTEAVRPGSVVIGFPGGSATVEGWVAAE